MKLVVGQRLWAWDEHRRGSSVETYTVVAVGRTWAQVRGAGATRWTARVTAEPDDSGVHKKDNGKYTATSMRTDAQYVALMQNRALAQAATQASNRLSTPGNMPAPDVVLAVCALLGVECPPLPTADAILAGAP